MSPAAAKTATPPPLDVTGIRAQFPGLDQQVRGRPLVYLDNGATSQTHERVLDELRRFHLDDRANVHRGVHVLSQRATDRYEGARETVRAWLNAEATDEIIFVRGTTEAINLVSTCFGKLRLGPGDEVLISAMEHHSNIVPWQMACADHGARLVVAPIDDDGALDMTAFEGLLSPRTKMVAVTHVSNALGTVNPVERIVALAHGVGAAVLIDGAQAMPHQRVDVRALGCDFYAFSSHKVFGPTGVGVLYGRRELLDAMPPYQGGGDMIRTVTFEETTYNGLPYKFEAGTPNIAGVIGLGAALDFLATLDMRSVAAHEADLLAYATERLGALPSIRFIGTAPRRASLVSFVLDCAHPHDIGTFCDQRGVAIRTGHHCAQPVMDRFGVPATARASFALYNTRAEVDALVDALGHVLEVFG